MKAKEKKVVGSVDKEYNGSKMVRYLGVVTKKNVELVNYLVF